MAYLCDYTKGRDNNFNLIRFTLALVVLVAHGFNIYSNSPQTTDPLIAATYKIGFMALDVFFVFSGFMVTASIERRPELIEFFTARALRIFPALIFIVLISTIIIGPITTTIPLSSYFTATQTYSYLLVTSATTNPDMTLPGVFVDHAASGAINRPIWTLRYELILYVILAIAFILGIIKQSKMFFGIILLLVLAYLGKISILGVETANSFLDHFSHFAISFLIGTAAWIYRSKIVLSFRVFCMLVLATLVLQSTVFVEFIIILTAAYGVFWLAYIPGGIIRKYNRFGDYSYGVYIMHWPIASMLLSLNPKIEAYQLIPITAAMTILLAILSWHYIEKPALQSTDKVTVFIKAIFSYRLKLRWWVK